MVQLGKIEETESMIICRANTQGETT